uniref:(S)-2-hydroxy-acid oxidase n=1 Tax=Oryza punctata TaxID=4537 RepID=A0A0E0LNC1_ORYPU
MEDNLPVNVREYQELAKKVLPKMAYDYINGGAEDEHTLRENIAAYTRIILRPRVLVDVLSFASSCKIEDVNSSCNAIRFYQLYVYKNRNISATLVQRAESCGFKALVLTVDTPMLGRREADIRNKMIFPRSGNLEGLMTIDDHDTTNGSQLERFARATLDPSLSWKDIEWLKSITSMPIFLKGIVTAEDELYIKKTVMKQELTGENENGWHAARRAVEAGVAGVIVSNHGARQLDYAPATIAALEEVVRAVAGALPVLVDGGIRRGTDVFKALALGARAVMVGRPVFFGLAARGEAGARHVIEMLNGELEVAMALCGCRSVGEITRSHVMTEGDRIRSLL